MDLGFLGLILLSFHSWIFGGFELDFQVGFLGLDFGFIVFLGWILLFSGWILGVLGVGFFGLDFLGVQFLGLDFRGFELDFWGWISEVFVFGFLGLDFSGWIFQVGFLGWIFDFLVWILELYFWSWIFHWIFRLIHPKQTQSKKPNPKKTQNTTQKNKNPP